MKLKLRTESSFNSPADTSSVVESAIDALISVESLRQSVQDMEELDVIHDNLQLVASSISRCNDVHSALEMLDATESVSNLLGVAEEKLTDKVALEGLGSAIIEAVKSFFKKCKEVISKIIDWIVNKFTGLKRKCKNLKDRASEILSSSKTGASQEALADQTERSHLKDVPAFAVYTLETGNINLVWVRKSGAQELGYLIKAGFGSLAVGKIKEIIDKTELTADEKTHLEKAIADIENADGIKTIRSIQDDISEKFNKTMDVDVEKTFKEDTLLKACKRIRDELLPDIEKRVDLCTTCKDNMSTIRKYLENLENGVGLSDDVVKGQGFQYAKRYCRAIVRNAMQTANADLLLQKRLLLVGECLLNYIEDAVNILRHTDPLKGDNEFTSR